MKKRILSVILVAVLLFSLSGCADVETESSSDNKPMFICVETASTWKVVYHRETKVMYVVSDGSYNCGAFALLVDADGNPMLWEKRL